MGAIAVASQETQANQSLSGVERGSQSVLILYSDDRLFRANIVFDEVLRQTLGASLNQSIECYSEFLDEVRFPLRHQERMQEFLKAKYGERPPGVIVAFAPASLDFCLQSQLFPETPVVFAAIGTDTHPESELGARVTGVRSNFDGPATLSLALRLHPDTRRVFIVADSMALNHERAPTGWSTFRQKDFDVEFRDLTNQPLPQLLDTLAQLPANSLVIYLSLFGSGNGNAITSQALVERMSRVAHAPIYAALDAFVGHGIVGAVTTPTEAIARKTAEMVVMVLARESDDVIPPVQVLDATPIFDWRQIERWDLRQKQLPKGSIVLFAPPSLWQQHARWVTAAVVVFLVQSGLILALVLQSVRRRRAEREARQRGQELAHATRVATMGELTASLAHEINQPLAAILSNAQAAQRLLAAGASNGDEIGEILADIAADDQRAGEVIRRMRALLRKGESEPIDLDINTLVADVANLVHGELILQNVGLTLELSPAPLWVHGDRIQLQQVLLNLVMNALDAMKDLTSGERKLEIRTTIAEGRFVQVSVKDSGVGVPAENIERIFERFVTTKPHGMGLGLAICSSVIEAHGGRVGVRNNPDRGATFWFGLPTVQKVQP